MDDTGFEARATAALERVAERLESAAADDLDIDLEDGVLTVELASGAQYVLNRHAPSGQLWLSSPASGAGRFAPDPESDAWHDVRGGGDLVERLEGELSRALGRPLALS